MNRIKKIIRLIESKVDIDKKVQEMDKDIKKYQDYNYLDIIEVIEEYLDIFRTNVKKDDNYNAGTFEVKFIYGERDDYDYEGERLVITPNWGTKADEEIDVTHYENNSKKRTKKIIKNKELEKLLKDKIGDASILSVELT